MSTRDARHMRHALTLGRRGLGHVGAWPSVGCVIAQGARIVGRGSSDLATLRHAEVVALDQAGDKARGATAYVTLEPCSHTGRTSPCADALIKAGIARVVIATSDPNPLVAGQGIEKLKAAGLTVDIGLFEAEARQDNAGFLTVQEQDRARLTLKLATTLDGRIATASGESRWITGPEARRMVHAMRLSHDAVLVGGGTARADDPTLTVRDLGAATQPTRIVASRRLNLPWPNRLANSIAEGPVLLIHGPDDVDPADAKRWTDTGATLISSTITAGQLDPRAMLETLGKHGLTRIFCEGGGTLAASLLQAGVVDELITFTAAKFIGAEGQPAVGAMGISALAESPAFDLIDCQSVGNDVMQVWMKA